MIKRRIATACLLTLLACSITYQAKAMRNLDGEPTTPLEQMYPRETTEEYTLYYYKGFLLFEESHGNGYQLCEATYCRKRSYLSFEQAANYAIIAKKLRIAEDHFNVGEDGKARTFLQEAKAELMNQRFSSAINYPNLIKECIAYGYYYNVKALLEGEDTQTLFDMDSECGIDRQFILAWRGAYINSVYSVIPDVNKNKRYAEVIKLLSADPRINVNAQGLITKETALMTAAHSGLVDGVIALLQSNKINVLLTNDDGKTALQIARDRRNDVLYQDLIQKLNRIILLLEEDEAEAVQKNKKHS